MASNKILHSSMSRRGILALVAAAFAAAIWSGNAGAETVKQVPLSPKQIENYMSAVKDIAPLLEQLDAAGDKGNPKIEAAIEAIAKKNGFSDTLEYESVDLSISVVMRGIDPETKQYSDPIPRLKKELAEVQADKKMSAADRKKAIEEINAELTEAQPVQHPGNIELVLKYYDKLKELLDRLFPESPDEQPRKI